MSGLLQRARFRRDHRWAPSHMSPYLEDDVGASVRARLESHCAGCPECSRLLMSLRRMLAVLSAVPPARTPAAIDVASAVRERLQEDQDIGPERGS